MLMIKLVDARKGLHEKCVELFNNEKVAESIYMYLCDGIEECDAVEPEQFNPFDSDYAEGFMSGLNKAIWVIEKWVPSAQPDLSSYSDKLWRNAYERGRLEAEAEIIRCKDCKHRPIEKDGEIMPPKEDDWKCPCLCDDYFYSWRPKDNFFCASGERREK